MCFVKCVEVFEVTFCLLFIAEKIIYSFFLILIDCSTFLERTSFTSSRRIT